MATDSKADLITLAQASRTHGISMSTLYRMKAAGLFEFVQNGRGTIRIRPDAILTLLTRSSPPSTSRPAESESTVDGSATVQRRERSGKRRWAERLEQLVGEASTNAER